MNNIVLFDVILVLFIALWGVLGLKRGVIKQAVMTIGTVLVFVIAFFLKNPLAEVLSLNLPFFEFMGIFKGVAAINIIFYQLLSFVIAVIVLQLILKVLVKVSSVLENILKITIIFAIPSKILGFILGIIEGVVVAYIALFFLTQPLFNLKIFNDSKLTGNILNNVPVLSGVAKGFVNTFNDIYELTENYYDSENSSNQFNLDAIEVMLKNKVIDVNYVEKLIENEKIDVVGIDNLLNQYR